MSAFRTGAHLLGVFAMVCAVSFACAQQVYPAKPITLLIP